MRRVQYLTVEDVIGYHDVVIEQSGGAPGVLKPEQLEASVMAPQATYAGEPLHETLADIASAYGQYIATSHSFVDGNKRTAFAAMLAFLEVNGFALRLTSAEEWIQIMVEVATGDISRERLAELLASAMGEWGELKPA
jgi:death on curing protein